MNGAEVGQSLFMSKKATFKEVVLTAAKRHRPDVPSPDGSYLPLS